MLLARPELTEPKPAKPIHQAKPILATPIRPRIALPADQGRKNGDGDSQSDIEVLPEYEAVKALLKAKYKFIFVTGGAGTGKSTFIRWLVREYGDSTLLAAPTGIAALNIGGRTIHSLCQLPIRFILKREIKEVPRRTELKTAKLLVIDEISMVNANVLDSMSFFFRINRDVDLPFGGLPVVAVGDLFQLPPIVKDKDLFERYYDGQAKFYGAKCLAGIKGHPVELNRNFRQENKRFAEILSNLREGIEVDNSIAILNAECTVTDTPPAGTVWLSPRNAEVDYRNLVELEKIDAPTRTYLGKMEGEFKEENFPAPFKLVLKCGAQVMFTKNDGVRRWVNGTVGTVWLMEDNNIIVELAESHSLVDVSRTTWTDFRFRWNPANAKIEREPIGSFTQFPLMLAWAVTIHKSQGRTIDRVHLDLGAGAFQTGQTYVALSRCRSLDGLSMSRPLAETDIQVDQESKRFYADLRSILK